MNKIITGKNAIYKERFAQNYVLTGGKNVTASMRVANPRYSNQTAAMTGQRWLKDPVVKAYIADLEREINPKFDDVVDKSKQILKELDIVSFFDPRPMFDVGTEERTMLDKLGDSARAVTHIKIKKTRYKKDDHLEREDEVEIDIRSANKLEALKLYGQHHKLYTEMTEGKLDVKHPTWSMPDNGGRKETA